MLTIVHAFQVALHSLLCSPTVTPPPRCPAASLPRRVANPSTAPCAARRRATMQPRHNAAASNRRRATSPLRWKTAGPQLPLCRAAPPRHCSAGSPLVFALYQEHAICFCWIHRTASLPPWCPAAPPPCCEGSATSPIAAAPPLHRALLDSSMGTC